MKGISFFLLFMVVQIGVGQDLEDVSDSLTENASELIVYDSTFFYVKNINESYLERKYKIIVFQDPFKEGKSVYLYQDKFKEVDFVKMTVTSKNGEVSESVKLKDFHDVSTKGYSLASDNRVLYYRVVENELPYTIEVAYKVLYSGSMFYPNWQPQEEDVAVLSAAFTVESEIKNSFRFQSYNVQPKIENNGKLVQWTVSNLRSHKYEHYSREPEYYGPVVYTAPNQFQMDLIEGNMESWASFGDWINKLNFGKDDLKQSVFDDLKKLIPEDATDLEKIRIVYDYMQDRTRYVSIQLGIGGWQPFNSDFVHESGYGDCKALSFYTQSLLTRVGIESYYTLIRAGKNTSDINKDFPMSQFNHAILTVPVGGDTVWLECTSQTNPFGYLGTFTSDRNALMIKPNGSEIIRTKTYSLNENRKHSKYKIKISSQGVADVALKTIYSGIMIEQDHFDNMALSDSRKQLDWFIDNNDWNSMHVESLTLTPPSDEIVPEASLQAAFRLENSVKRAGKRMFVPMGSFLKSEELVLDKQPKNYPFEINYSKKYIDSLIFVKPIGYQVEAPLRGDEFKNDFGSVSFSFKQNGDEILLVRSLTIEAGVFEPHKYSEFQEFVSKVKKTESKQLVLINKT